jgi:hypothetical protein
MKPAGASTLFVVDSNAAVRVPCDQGTALPTYKKSAVLCEVKSGPDVSILENPSGAVDSFLYGDIQMILSAAATCQITRGRPFSCRSADRSCENEPARAPESLAALGSLGEIGRE